MKDLSVLAFDADDTLWVNEPYFRRAEEQFCTMLEEYLPAHAVAKELYRIEMQNLPLYGYGIKAFMLSMIETVRSITGPDTPAAMIDRAMELGKEMLDLPVVLLDGVKETLEALKSTYKLVIATKGDLLDQERKLMKSGLSHYFHHIEIMSDKKEKDYLKLLRQLDCPPPEFLMIGNSLKSDIMPVLAIGGKAAHIPYHITWEHEVIHHSIDHPDFYELTTIADLPGRLGL